MYIIQKECIQIIRNRGMLPILIIMPLVQLLILANVATFDIRNVRLYIVDRDVSSFSRELIRRFPASGYFIRSGESFSENEVDEILQTGQADMVMNIPPQFEKDLYREQQAKIQFIINAVDGQAAQIMRAYGARIVQDFMNEWNQKNGAKMITPEVQTRFWYNLELDYQTFMIPGILAILVTIIGVFLSGMNIVREKENGTIEQLNVTPIGRPQFIIGKLAPFWVIGLIELAFGLTVAKFTFNIPMLGSLPLLFLAAAIYLLAVLGIGLLISTVTETQQQAMFVAWFFMVIFILMSGFFTPLESMPAWAQGMTRFNPMAYFMKIMRAVLIKGSGWETLWPNIAALSGFAVTFLSLAVWRYRKVSI